MAGRADVRCRYCRGKFLRALIAGIAASNGWRAGIAVALMVGASLTEGLSVLLLFPLLQLAGINLEASALNRVTLGLERAFNIVGIAPTLVVVLIAYVAVVAVQATLVREQSLLNATVFQNFGQHLRTRLYRAIAQTEWLTLSRIRSSDFTFALTTAIDRVEGATQLLLMAGATLAVTLVYVVLSLALSPAMSAVVVGAALLIIVLQHGSMLGARSPGQKLVESTTDLYATAAEQLGGLKTAKSYGHEHRHVDMFLEAAQRLNTSSLSVMRTYANFRWRQTVGAVIALGVILFLSVRVFHLPTGAILVLLLLFSRLIPRLVSIQQSMQRVIGDLPALESIESLITACESSPEHALPTRTAIEPGEVTLRDVSFSYGGTGAVPTLSDINLALPAMQTTALVGASGAGKTTLVDILLGLIKPDSGEILVNDTLLDSARLSSWRSQIGYVSQDTYLFNESVRANLAWAEPSASEGEMWEALRAASAEEFVSQLPRGIDTAIGERGVRLSGGEKQRISLARALLRKPALLILDEATSALDTENEQRIYQAIKSLSGRMTIVVITHRLSTIRFADMIHVIDRGRVVASGNWEALTSGSNPRFRELAFGQVSLDA